MINLLQQSRRHFARTRRFPREHNFYVCVEVHARLAWPGSLKERASPPLTSHMTYPEAMVVGLIQGVTELFPVSSLGHNVIIPGLIGGRWKADLNVSSPESPYLAFVVGLHVATAIGRYCPFLNDPKAFRPDYTRTLRTEWDFDATLTPDFGLPVSYGWLGALNDAFGKLHEGAKLRQARHRPFDHRARRKFLCHRRPGVTQRLLEAEGDAAFSRVHSENHGFDGLARFHYVRRSSYSLGP